MNKEELIGKLQMVYVGDRNALNELIGYYDGLKEVVEIVQKENEKLNHYKLLYQKVKERNDEALKFVEKFYKIEVTNDLHLMNKIDQTILLGILKGDNNE